MLYVILGVGIGNLGRSGRGRVPMTDLITQVNGRLRERSCAARIVCSFGHTGNFVARVDGPHDETAGGQLVEALGFDAAVLRIGEVRAAIEQMSASMGLAPAKEAGCRWTAGMAVRVSGPVTDAPVRGTDRGVLLRISSDVVGVWKRDAEAPDGTLDRDARGGGWGALASAVGEQVGGRWTARSLRTVTGIAGRGEALARSPRP